MVKGKVIQFRRGKRTQYTNHFLIEVEGTSTRENAEKFKGHEVVWTSPGKDAKKINGKIASAHGKKGVIRAIFERGLPGQAIGTEVEIK